MNNLLRFLYFGLLVRPIVKIFLGMNVRGREKMPPNGPLIIAANHNSHLDTMVLMSLVPLRKLPIVHPVAAADYFMKNKLLAWFATQLIGIIPLQRNIHSSHEKHPLDGCFQALEENQILILFPEGSRGQPERLSTFKKGIAHLAERYPEIPIVPIFMHGLGKSLPKGEALLVPFICDIFIGNPLTWNGDRNTFLHTLDSSMETLAKEGNFPAWD